MHDLLITGGTIVDGYGGEPYRGDVAVDGRRITAVGSNLGRARRLLDARQALVCPGFVDMHTHTDFTLPMRPAAAAKLLQGVTTDCTGNCGFSPFPLMDDQDAREHGGFLEPTLRARWPDLASYASEVIALRPGINIVPLIGLGAIRLAVVGKEDRRASEAELARMQGLIATMISQGAAGASSGLVYAPSGYADLSELIALTKPVAAAGRLYATHMRDEGDHLDASVDEALETAVGSGCRLQISHHKAMGRPNWGKVAGTLKKIARARQQGMDVAVDMYPYTAGCTTLAAALPPTAFAGGEEALRERLKDPAARREMAATLRTGEKPLDAIILGAIPSRPDIAGRRLEDVARDDGIPPGDLLVQLVARDGLRCVMIIEAMAEDDVRRVLTDTASVFGSDGWTMAIDAVPYAHPRDFAAAVRFLVRYVRDDSVLPLSAAIAKLTALPAARLGLRDRGVIAPDFAADLTVIDLDGLREVASYEAPCHHPLGVEHVVVNGVVAVEDGVITGLRGGRVILAPG